MARTKRKNVDTLPKYSFHNIRLGDTGHAVAFTQWVLNQLGWYNGTIDGIFGQKTLTAVRKFQSSHNLTVSGVVDRPIRYALYGDAVDKGFLKSMPTPYYVNNWTLQEQTSETSHETAPGTSTSVPAELLQEVELPQSISKLAPTAIEYAEQLPDEYLPETQTQTKYRVDGWNGTPEASMYPYPHSTGTQPSTPSGYYSASGMPAGMMQPGMMQPGMMQPGMMQPGMMQPGMMQPGTMQPGMMQPGTMQPGAMQPGAMQPGVMQPGVMQPSTMQPGAMQPGTMQPGAMQPGTMQPGTIGTQPSEMELPYGMSQYWQQQMEQGTEQQMRDWYEQPLYPMGFESYLRWEPPTPYYLPLYAYPFNEF